MNTDTRTRRAFISSIKHQLRTPLNAIIGYSEMLIEDVQEDDVAQIRDEMEHVHLTGHRLLTLVNTIFDPDQLDDEKDSLLNLEDYRNRVHHQLRNPLNIVIGYTEIAQEKCAAKQRHPDFDFAQTMADLDKIDQAAQTLVEDIDDIIQVALMDREDQEVTDEPMSDSMSNLSSIVEGVVTTLTDLENNLSERRYTGRLLVVDDSPASLEILSRQLQRHGHEIVGMRDGRQALELLEQESFDLVILDLIMPDFNGYELLMRINKSPHLENVPVIVLSALDDVDSMIQGIALGAQDYITKPFNPVLLQARINALLERKKLRDLEIDYRENVAIITTAAAAIESSDYEPENLNPVAQRTDDLGRLARVFQNMAYEVLARERRLQDELRELRIRIDHAKEAQQVAEIVETDYFQALQRKVRDLRATFSGE